MREEEGGENGRGRDGGGEKRRVKGKEGGGDG